MKLIHGIENFDEKISHSVLTIGNFDGVHQGHQKLLYTLLQQAKETGGCSVALTFNPHPKEFFHPEKTFKKINTHNAKIKLLERDGLDYLIEQKFDSEFSQHSKEEFLKKIIIEKLKTRVLILGYDFVFGKNKKGNTSYLKKELPKYNIKLLQLEPSLDKKGEIISSSNIRKLLSSGNIEEAYNQLGRAFFITEKVIKGNDRGKNVTTYPTINMNLPKGIVIPKNGVYITRALVRGKLLNSITNIGVQPSFENSKPSLETHILNFNRNCYDETIRIYFFSFLREEKKFNEIKELKEQIRKDISSIKNYKYPKNPSTSIHAIQENVKR